MVVLCCFVSVFVMDNIVYAFSGEGTVGQAVVT